MGKDDMNIDTPDQSGGRGVRCFNNILCFTVVFGVSSLLMETVKLYTVSQITALEKQFGLSSTRSGLLLSCNEIGYLVAIFFFSHFGGRRFIPRILSCALALYGTASLIFGLLYFINPLALPRFEDQASNNSSLQSAGLCQDSMQEDEQCSDKKNQEKDSSHWEYNVFAVLMVIVGVAKSSRSSLGLPYVDNNSRDKQQSSLLTGILVTMAFLGPFTAFSLGGLFSDIPVDLSESQLDTFHPEWIGAWWVGYLVIGCAALLFAVPLGLFPRHIKKPSVEDTDTTKSLKDDIVDMPRSVLRILKNPVVCSLLLGSVCIAFFVGGHLGFAPKYIETQFALTASRANFIMGILQLVWAVSGTLLGGIITSRLRLTNMGCLKLATITVFARTVLYSLTLFFGCDSQNIKALGDNRSSMANGTTCICNATKFMPLCGVDGVTYINPCMAGCQSQNDTTYLGCSDIPGNEATEGRCPTDCPYLYPYIIVELVTGLVGTVSIVPTVMTIMKTVHPRDKSMAVALTAFLDSVLGFLPSPVVYGKVIDTTCTLWETTCGEVGACAVYDLPSLRYRVKGMDVGLTVLFSAAYLAALLFLKYDVSKTNPDSDASQTQREASEESEKPDVPSTKY